MTAAPGPKRPDEVRDRYTENGDPVCDRCQTVAHWSICDLEITDSITAADVIDPVVRWFACGRHLHTVLASEDWSLDTVHVYDLTAPEESS